MQLILTDPQADALAEMLTSFLESEFDKMREGISHTIAETRIADDLTQMIDDIDSGQRAFDLNKDMAKLVLEVHEAFANSREGEERNALDTIQKSIMEYNK